MSDTFKISNDVIFSYTLKKDLTCASKKAKALAEKKVLRGEIFFQKDIDELYNKDICWFYGDISTNNYRNGIQIINISEHTSHTDHGQELFTVDFKPLVIFGDKNRITSEVMKLIADDKCYLKARISPNTKSIITFDLIIKEDSGIDPSNLCIY